LGQYLVGIIGTGIYFLVTSAPVGPPNLINHKKGIQILFIICLTNGIGHFMTNWSMQQVAVSFTHTIKSCEPIFSVLFAMYILNSNPTIEVLVSLIPITIGTVMATTTELSYSHLGFITAMASNALFSSRNIYTKKLQVCRKIFPEATCSSLRLGICFQRGFLN
jgi:drug/metabolite transporter (DMT)-like permease